MGPHEAHIHALDLAGRLDVLSHLPHTGTLAGRGQITLAATLIARLEQEVQRRHDLPTGWARVPTRIPRWSCCLTGGSPSSRRPKSSTAAGLSSRC
jgi:hypothetical protein